MTTNQLATSPKPVHNCSVTTHSDTSDPLSSNGGLIAMAAGLSVVLPLICVLVIQLRRTKLAERERLRLQALARDNALSDPLQDPPPLYEHVFGPNFNYSSSVQNSTSAVSSVESELSQTGNGNIYIENESTFTNPLRDRRSPGFTSARGSGDVHENNQLLQSGIRTPTSSISAISGYRVADIPISYSDLYYETNEISSNDSTTTIHTSLTTSECNNEHNSSHTATSSNNSSPMNVSNSSSSLETSSSYSSALGGSVPQNVCTVVANQNDNYRNTNTVTLEMGTPHPRMHMSVLELFTSLVGQQDIEADSPPPSYEEALKILESAALTKKAEHIIHG